MKLQPLKLIFLLAILALVGGCAGRLPVPGGTDTTNESFYDSREEMLKRLEGLHAGMPESVVLQKLNRREGELQKLKREEIVTALLGTSNIEFKEGFGDQLAGSNLIQSLYGYRLDYQMVEREHGFSSPI